MNAKQKLIDEFVLYLSLDILTKSLHHTPFTVPLNELKFIWQYKQCHWYNETLTNRWGNSFHTRSYKMRYYFSIFIISTFTSQCEDIYQHAIHPSLVDAVRRIRPLNPFEYVTIVTTVRQRKASVTSPYDCQVCRPNLFLFPLNVGVVSQTVCARRTLVIHFPKAFGDPFG